MKKVTKKPKKCDDKTYNAFVEFSLSDKIIKGLSCSKYYKPTKIQKKVIPHCLIEKDVVVQSETGSGKTLAYLVPLIELLSKNVNVKSLECLILVPTSELAFQISNVFHNLIKYQNEISYAVLTGGRNKKGKEQEVKISPSVRVIIATPGRFIDLATMKLNFFNFKFLILDEADALLNDNFFEELRNVIDILPNYRITWLYSATLNLSNEAVKLISLKDPIYIGFNEDDNNSYIPLPKHLVQCYVTVDLPNKVQELWNLLEASKTSKIMVFFSTQKEVIFFYLLFKELKPNYKLFHIRKNLRLDKRIKAIESFLKSQTGVLFSTDLGCRGVDFPDLRIIIHFDLPRDLESYFHRSGRTARLHNKGSSILMIMPSEMKFLNLIENKNITIRKLNKPSVDGIDISEQLSNYYIKNMDLFVKAKLAILAFIKDYSERELTDIFVFNELPIKDYCKSLGFSDIPSIDTEFSIEQNNKNENLSIPTSILRKCTEFNENMSDFSDDDNKNNEEKLIKNDKHYFLSREKAFDFEEALIYKETKPQRVKWTFKNRKTGDDDMLNSEDLSENNLNVSEAKSTEKKKKKMKDFDPIKKNNNVDQSMENDDISEFKISKKKKKKDYDSIEKNNDVDQNMINDVSAFKISKKNKRKLESNSENLDMNTENNMINDDVSEFKVSKTKKRKLESNSEYDSKETNVYENNEIKKRKKKKRKTVKISEE